MYKLRRPLPAPSVFGRVAVVMGGWSSEREVSLMGGQAVLVALQNAGVNAQGLDVGLDVVEQIQKGGYDRAFIMLHGEGGEDGRLQAALDFARIPYTGTGMLGSALCMDKMRTKWICQPLNIPTPAWRAVSSEHEVMMALEQLGPRVVVKPSCEGSSVGVSIISHPAEVSNAYALAAKSGQVIVEQCIEGQEVTVAMVDGEPLPVIGLNASRAFYDYKAKYDDNSGTHYQIPAQLPQPVTQEVQRLTALAFDALACFGWARADYIIDASGQPWFIEMNTVPGMTTHSLVPMAAQAANISMPELVCRILASTLR